MKQLSEIWPRTTDLAEDLGVPYTTADSWKRRGSIPAARDLDLIEAAARRGVKITLEDIAQHRRAANRQDC